MKEGTYDILNIGLYKSAWQSLIENPIWKTLFAALISLFEVPVEFIVGLPIFWLLDFWAGAAYSKREARKRGEKKWFDEEKMRKQFGKITLHLGALTGIIVFANLANTPSLIPVGFFYIIVHEFLFSSLPKFLGEEKGNKLARHMKNIFLSHFGLNDVFNVDDTNDKDKVSDAN